MRRIYVTSHENGAILCPATFIFKGTRATNYMFLLWGLLDMFMYFHWPFVVEKWQFSRVSGIICAPFSRENNIRWYEQKVQERKEMKKHSVEWRVYFWFDIWFSFCCNSYERQKRVSIKEHERERNDNKIEKWERKCSWIFLTQYD